MNTGTRAAIEALLKADPTLAPDHRRAILDACDKRPQAAKAETLLTIREAAARSGKCRRTLFRWIEEGRLEPVRLTARLFQIREADLNRILDRADGPPPGREGQDKPERLAAAMKHAQKGRKAGKTP